MEWLHNNPMGVAIVVALLIFVLAFVVLTAMKRRTERAD